MTTRLSRVCRPSSLPCSLAFPLLRRPVPRRSACARLRGVTPLGVSIIELGPGRSTVLLSAPEYGPALRLASRRLLAPGSHLVGLALRRGGAFGESVAARLRSSAIRASSTACSFAARAFWSSIAPSRVAFSSASACCLQVAFASSAAARLSASLRSAGAASSLGSPGHCRRSRQRRASARRTAGPVLRCPFAPRPALSTCSGNRTSWY